MLNIRGRNTSRSLRLGRHAVHVTPLNRRTVIQRPQDSALRSNILVLTNKIDKAVGINVRGIAR